MNQKKHNTKTPTTQQAASLGELAAHLSAVLRHPLTPVSLYNAITDEVTPLQVSQRDLQRLAAADEADEAEGEGDRGARHEEIITSAPFIERALRQRRRAARGEKVREPKKLNHLVVFEVA